MPKDLLASKGRDLLGNINTESDIPTPDKLVNNVGKERFNSFLTGGFAGLGEPKAEIEETFPVVGAIGGGIAGAHVGHPNFGSAVGAGTGDLLKQTINKLKGDGSDIDVNDSLTLGVLTGLGGKAFESVIKAGGVTLGLIPNNARAKLFDKTLQAANIGKKQLSRVWNSQVSKLISENPETRVNMKPVLMKLKDQLKGEADDLIPQIKTAIKRNKFLSNLLDDSDDVIGFKPDKGIGLTLKEANELKNTISSANKAATGRALKGQATPQDLAFFDIIDEFDTAITKDFPGMRDVRNAYHEGKKAFNLVRPLVEPGEAIEKTVLSKPQGILGLEGSPFFRSAQQRVAAGKVFNTTASTKKLFRSLQMAHIGNRATDAISRLAAIKVGSDILGFGDN